MRQLLLVEWYHKWPNLWNRLRYSVGCRKHVSAVREHPIPHFILIQDSLSPSVKFEHQNKVNYIGLLETVSLFESQLVFLFLSENKVCMTCKKFKDKISGIFIGTSTISCHLFLAWKSSEINFSTSTVTSTLTVHELIHRNLTWLQRCG
jgi:hypothetical protein